MRRYLILTAMWLVALLTSAQGAIGTWRLYPAYHKATQCVEVGGTVYVLSDGALYTYTASDEYVETYDKAGSLSDQGIRHIALDETTGTVVVVYNNANIDLLHTDGSVLNITDYANKPTLDPAINDIRIVGGRAYLATNFGLTVLDVERGVFANTYTLGRAVLSATELDGVIFAATAEGLYRGDTRDNLLDITNWHCVSTNSYAKLVAFDGMVVALGTNKAVYRVDPASGKPAALCKGSFSYVHCSDERLVVGNATSVYVYESLDDYNVIALDGTATYATLDGGILWTCNGAQGLNKYAYGKASQEIVHLAGPIIPNSPVRNHCQYLHFASDDRLLIAGGCLNYFDETFFDGTLMMYEEGEWSSFQEEGIAEQTGVYYKNMTSIVQDPKDATHHYASSFGQGIYEFRDGELVAHYNHKNSALESVSSNPDKLTATRVSRLQYDAQGNLWITNADGAGRVKAPLKVMTPDGTMTSLYYKELEYLPTVTEVLFDSRGWTWVVSMPTTCASSASTRAALWTTRPTTACAPSTRSL